MAAHEPEAFHKVVAEVWRRSNLHWYELLASKPPPRDTGVVTFKDWLDARDWPPKGRKYHEDGSFTDPFPVAGLTFGPDLSE